MYSSYNQKNTSAAKPDFVQHSLTNDNAKCCLTVTEVYQPSIPDDQAEDDAVVFYIPKTMTPKQIDCLVSRYAFELPAMLEQFFCELAKCSDPSSAKTLQELLETFLQQPIDHHDIGLFGILDRLYFSWRMLEEANDYVGVYHRQSLLPWDMTEANLIAHQLLGSTYADILDRLVIDLAEQFVSKPLQSLSIDSNQANGHKPPPYLS
ncbi:hypothetical protein [Reinekea thalattae]|uniref:Uncharacterized protein n=1 Tax=Reinekea thalattae TaxID=2593301 RepID=A0A5C8ZCV0_9GAMM|nr:hypothetical protein [Reinekea thalattae]TXR54736.1 hypothetical protein FME95_09420 [Reinekea thalattae]